MILQLSFHSDHMISNWFTYHKLPSSFLHKSSALQLFKMLFLGDMHEKSFFSLSVKKTLLRPMHVECIACKIRVLKSDRIAAELSQKVPHSKYTFFILPFFSFDSRLEHGNCVTATFLTHFTFPLSHI